MHRPFALPGVRPRYAPDRAFQVRHLRLELALDWDKKSVAGSATLSLRRIHATRRLELDAVELRIELPAGTPDELDVRIDYTCQPRRGLYFIGPEAAYPQKPREIWSQGQDEDSRHWFPCFDAPNQKATTELIV